MTYSSNQYNVATPPESIASLFSESYNVLDSKYFTMFANTLDGSCVPITGDVGLWGTSLSDVGGYLFEPMVVTVDADVTINALRIVGSENSYPVDFTVELYDYTGLVYTIVEHNNSRVEYTYGFPRLLHIMRYVITITRISHSNAVAMLRNISYPPYVKRADTLGVSAADTGAVSSLSYLYRQDTVLIGCDGSCTQSASNDVFMRSRDTARILSYHKRRVDVSVHASDRYAVALPHIDTVCNTIDVTRDVLRVAHRNATHITNTAAAHETLRARAIEATSSVTNTIDTTTDKLSIVPVDTPVLTNVHTRMKDASRSIYGKVYITYTDPILDTETRVTTSMEAYNSNKAQVMDGDSVSDGRYFTLYDNDLTGAYVPMTERSQVGWVTGIVSGDNGIFRTAQYLNIAFSARPVMPLTIYFDDSHGCVAEDFDVGFEHENRQSTRMYIRGNTSNSVLINDEVLIDVVAIHIRVTKASKPGMPVAILEVPTMSTVLYEGYKDHSDIISIDLLEELTYDDAVESLGGISANEVTVKLDNSSKTFYFNNKGSAVARQLRRNRKIEPWLGVEIIPGEIEWHKLGTFWSYSWNVPVNSLSATVVGFDTIGLLDTTKFVDHSVLTDTSIGSLVDYVLTDAKESLSFIKWQVDPALYDVVIPFAWFEAASHTEALRKISKAYPMHIYCDRDGVICAAPQKLKLDYYYDTWSDRTNVISKDYNSMYTTLPNVVNVSVKIPHVVSNETLVQDNLAFDVSVVPTRTLNFSKPYLSDLAISIDKDDNVEYTYTVYSWGATFNFYGSGTVRSIVCSGSAVDVSNTSTLTRTNDNSVRLNGAVSRDISADFIQTSELAAHIISRIFELSEHDRYDANVVYRGDIALSINDPILLLDGIAPDNRYNIRRHNLSWNGALSGSADLNT